MPFVIKRMLAPLLGISAWMLVSAVAMGQSSSGPVTVTESVNEQFRLLLADPRVQSALADIETNEPETLAEQVRLTEIPAPPFQEQRRAEYYLQQMHSRGLPDAYIDTEGNVIGIRRGSGDGPLFVIAAHLDTVFPLDTDVSVEVRDGRYYAPGISDDGRGLTALLTLISAINASGMETVGDIMFVGNVGEEGPGDLRGVKALFRDFPQIDGFVSIDGSGVTRITNGGTGSRRFAVEFTGPGGHSFSAFGLVSATHALGRAIAKIGDLQVPDQPEVRGDLAFVCAAIGIPARIFFINRQLHNVTDTGFQPSQFSGIVGAHIQLKHRILRNGID